MITLTCGFCKTPNNKNYRMNSNKLYLVSVILVLFALACNEDQHLPINQGGEAPPQIQNPIAEAMPGAVKITYEVPLDKNFLYVKAQAVLESGIVREVKASYYTNYLLIDGFSEEKEYLINLYSVGRNGKESEPIQISCIPQEAPIYVAYNSIKESLTETFGGVRFEVSNPSKANLRIYFYAQDQNEDWDVLETFYTSVEKTNFSIRGLDAIPQSLRMEVRDRWNNTTETFTQEFTPYYESKLDKARFKQYNLPSDQNTPHEAGRTMNRIWDEIYTNQDFVTTVGYGLPQWFTFDLGVKAKLSRIVVYNRTTGAQYIYNAGAVKEFELFGSLAPNPDGSWDESWIPLRDQPCVSFKPSGLPQGQYTEEDVQRQRDGEEFEFDYNEAVRYVRFKTNTVWGGTSIGHINIVEITLYGEVVE